MSLEDNNELAISSSREWIYYNLKYMFGTNRGLIILTVMYEMAVIGFLFLFSKPVVEIFGAPLIPIILDSDQQARFSRIVMLYHAIAVPFIGAIALFVLDTYKTRKDVAKHIKWLLFPSYILTSVSALVFAYVLPRNWFFHGLFIFGMSVVFVAAILVLIAVFPTKSFPEVGDSEDVPFIKGINLEQFNIALVTVCIIISVLIGAATAAYFGQGFNAF